VCSSDHTNTSYEVTAGNAESTLGLGPEEGQSPSADRGENDPENGDGQEKA